MEEIIPQGAIGPDPPLSGEQPFVSESKLSDNIQRRRRGGQEVNFPHEIEKKFLLEDKPLKQFAVLQAR